MAWLIIDNILAAVILTVACPQSLQVTAQKQVTGTCASIGYNETCCPPYRDDWSKCEASDGDCRCDAACHLFNECCSDVVCPKCKYKNAAWHHGYHVVYLMHTAIPSRSQNMQTVWHHKML